jgi:hypothetical protein
MMSGYVGVREVLCNQWKRCVSLLKANGPEFEVGAVGELEALKRRFHISIVATSGLIRNLFGGSYV